MERRLSGQNSAPNNHKNAVAFYHEGEQAALNGAAAMSDCKMTIQIAGVTHPSDEIAFSARSIVSIDYIKAVTIQT